MTPSFEGDSPMYANDRVRADRRAELLSKMENATIEMERLGDKDMLTRGEEERVAVTRRAWLNAANELETLDAEQREVDRVRELVVNAGRPGSNLRAVPGAPGAPGTDVVRSAVTGAANDECRFVYSDTRRPATVTRGQSFGEHELVRQHAEINAPAERTVIDGHGSLGNLVRAMSTTSGSAVVPTSWASNIIDRARNVSAVLRAGAQIVPMSTKTVNVGRLTGDPAAAFRTEGSLITASDPVFDSVVLDAKTMSALVVGSMEWFMDSPNVDQVVTDAIAQAVALQLDLVSLYGGVTSGAGTINLPTPPNPRGVLGALNAVAASSVLGSGAANGTSQTATAFWNEIVDLIFTVRSFNEEPTGLLWSSKLAQQYAKAYATDGQPVAMPAAVAEIPQFITNQIPSGYTQGTLTTAADAFVGDWRQLLIGQRLSMTIQTLTERYAENGQVGIVAHWRGDVQPARPRAFSVYKALKGA
ncbi:phage major capsid protein [Micromonospora chersina]|uniref:phage major capsid protein n=1 Tax=Micromonospora chersina TaxID=47854 RepID=UPI0037127EEE